MLEQMLDRIMRWVALDFDDHGGQAVTLWLATAKAALVVNALSVDYLWFSATRYAFFVAMLLFAGHVFLDATSIGMARPFLWASGVLLAPPVGAILCDRRRRAYHCPLPT
jgi:hypothetical protein